MEKRIWRSERALDGACAVCGRRHIHRDECATLKRRQNDGTDPDRPVPPYAGGLPS